MIFNLGYLILVTGLVLAAFGAVAGILGGRWRNAALVQSSFHAVYTVAGLVAAATLILWYGLLTDQFQVDYVWNTSERALPSFYKFTALWAGQAGSLLFWTLLLNLFTVAVALSFRRTQVALMPFVNATMLTTSLFFLVLLVFSANPFKLYDFVPADGRGLNPLLQNYWMIIHPVMLYLGYVGLTVPFAFAVAALASKQLGNTWVRVVRRWTLIPWMFLSTGILMGSHWAYLELGWGGYWAWDPVENASLLPWLTATAFLHSILIQERRGALKVWNVVLIWLTYFLVILGTFFTRSSVLQSVHNFASSDVGPYFLTFLAMVLFGFLWLLFDRLPLLRSENEIDSLSSREAAFLANNWLFTSITFTTLWGTVFPLFSEVITGNQIAVNAPWFNKVNGPLFLVLLLVMGIGPLLGWRRTSADALRKQLTWPVLITALFVLAFTFYSPQPYAIAGFAVCVLVTVTIVQEFVRGAAARRTVTGENPLAAVYQLMRRNGQRYGGYVVHLGIVMMGVAIVGFGFYQSTTNTTLAQGESVTLAGYTLTYTGIDQQREANRTEFRTHLTVQEQGGRTLGEVTARRNVYDKQDDIVTSEVGLYVRPSEDIYVLLNGWEGSGETATFTIFVNPLAIWLWLGGIVLVFGTLVCMWPHPVRREETVSTAAPVATTA